MKEMSLETNNNNGKGLKLDKEHFENHQYNFNPRTFKILEFKEDLVQTVVKKKEIDPTFDLKKIHRFTRESQLKRNKNLNNIQLEERNKTENIKDTENEEDLMKNTLHIVRDEAKNIMNISDQFKLRSQKFDDTFYKTFKPIEVEDFEKELMQKIFFKPNEEETPLIKSIEKPIKERKGYQQRNIIESFKEVYEEKKKEWKEDEKRLEEEKKLAQLKLLEINQFLKFTKNLERKGQLYIDGYSIREKKTNDNINEFNRTLTKNKFFSKKRMNNELQAFIDYKEKLEEERIQMLELEIEKKKNEELNLLIENNKPFEEFKERIKNEKNIIENEDFKFGQSENILIKPQISEEEIINNKLEEYNNYIAYRTQYKLNNNVKKKDKVQFAVEKIRVKNDDNKKFQRDEERKRSILNVDQEKLKENIKKQIEYVRKQSTKAPPPKGQELKIPNPPKSTYINFDDLS
jgi:hypothetical protein